MKKTAAVKPFGSVVRLMAALGMAERTYYKWPGDDVPLRNQPAVREAMRKELARRKRAAKRRAK